MAPIAVNGDIGFPARILQSGSHGCVYTYYGTHIVEGKVLSVRLVSQIEVHFFRGKIVSQNFSFYRKLRF